MLSHDPHLTLRTRLIQILGELQNAALDIRQGGTFPDLPRLEGIIADTEASGPVAVLIARAQDAASAAVARHAVRYILETEADREIAAHLVVASGFIARAKKVLND